MLRTLGLALAVVTTLLLAPASAWSQCPTLIDTITTPPGAGPGDYDAMFRDPGDVYYTDSGPTLVAIPPELSCAHWIRTRNADANASDAVFLEFTVLEPVDVYVLYDSRVAVQVDRSPPTWLTSGFSLTRIIVDVDASAAGSNDVDQEFIVYKKSFPAGTVSLGANGAAGADFVGIDGIETSQYVVAVTRPSAPLPSPSCPVPPTGLISSITPPPGRTAPPAMDPDYVEATLGPGSEYYTDRGATHTLTALAPEVSCAEWLKTRNDDKYLGDVFLPSFTVNQNAVVYVAYDSRIALQTSRVALPDRIVPDWLANHYTYTHRYVDITEQDYDQEFVLYSLAVGPGIVALDGNEASPEVPPRTPASNYVVAVVPDSDGDGVADTVDNCPGTANPAQRDADLDGVGDACDPCTLVDDPAQTGWQPLVAPPDFGVCPLAIEDGQSFTDLRAEDDHLFVADLSNFPLRPEWDAILTPKSAGSLGFFQVLACENDSFVPAQYDLPTPGNGYSGLAGGFGNDNFQIWKGYPTVATRQTRCIMGILGAPGSAATFDLDLDVLATAPTPENRNYDPVSGTFTAASEDFAADGTNHRWIFPGTTGLGQCQPFPLADGLQNPGDPNQGPAEASYLEETVPVENDTWDCCTWTFDSLDGVRGFPATAQFPVGSPVGDPSLFLPDNDGDIFPDRCDVCPQVFDLQFDEDGDRAGTACDSDDSDPNVCQNADADACDDCAAGSGPDPLSDGLDTDTDGVCDNTDTDVIPDDGDGSFVAGDAPCTGGNTGHCDDNCPLLDNADQADPDADGVGTACDNCPNDFNPGQDPAVCSVATVPAMSPLAQGLVVAAIVLAALAQLSGRRRRQAGA